jgi:hypothetical protein
MELLMVQELLHMEIEFKSCLSVGMNPSPDRGNRTTITPDQSMGFGA